MTDAAVAARTVRAWPTSCAPPPATPDITVSSFDADLLAMIRGACADLPVRTALLGDKTAPAAAVVRRAARGRARRGAPPAGRRPARPAGRGDGARLGLGVALWTVNRSRPTCGPADLGVDAVITDDVTTAWSELDRAADVREMAAA